MALAASTHVQSGSKYLQLLQPVPVFSLSFVLPIAGKREARQVSFLSVFLPSVHLRQRCFPALSWKRSLSLSLSPSPAKAAPCVCLAGKLFRSFFQPERGGRAFANFTTRGRRSDAQFQDSAALPSSPRSGGESLPFHLKQQRAKTFPPPPLLVLL